MDVWVKKIGEKRGKPHIYFDGNQIVRSGFSPGDKFDLVVDGKRVILSANNDGSRTISSRRAGEKNLPNHRHQLERTC